MKKFVWSWCIVAAFFLLPCSSFALMHISNSNMAWECSGCHPDGVGGGLSIQPCEHCHNNSNGADYDDFHAIKMATHSNAVIGSDKYGNWGRACLDCHDQHTTGTDPTAHNGIHATAGILYPSYNLADVIVSGAVDDSSPRTQTTFNLNIVTIHDAAWADPATWGRKSSDERGLLFGFYFSSMGKYIYYEVISADTDQMTISNVRTYFPPASTISGQLFYGMLLNDEVNGTAVNAAGPSTMAINDELGPDGTDSTPDGICQVCHTMTIHWRSDGTFSNHFSGWNCILCHPHEKGFKADPPNLCP